MAKDASPALPMPPTSLACRVGLAALAVTGLALSAGLLASHLVLYATIGVHEAGHCWVDRYVWGEVHRCRIEIAGSHEPLSDGSGATAQAITGEGHALHPWEHRLLYSLEFLVVAGMLAPGAAMTVPLLAQVERRRRSRREKSTPGEA